MKAHIVRGICALAAGLMIFRFGIPGMFNGGAAALEPGLVTAYLDSEYRFLSTLALGVGGLFIYLVLRFKDQPQLLLILAPAVLLGGLMRLVSMARFGPPTTAELIPTIIEIVLPGTAFVLTLLYVREQRGSAANP